MRICRGLCFTVKYGAHCEVHFGNDRSNGSTSGGIDGLATDHICVKIGNQ